MEHQSVDEVGVVKENQHSNAVDRLHQHSDTEDRLAEHSFAEDNTNEHFIAENKVYEHSDAEDRRRSSSSSSASAKSAISDFSFEDPNQIDRKEHGSFAMDHKEQSELVDSGNVAEAIPSSSSMLETPPAQVMERPPDTSNYRIPSRVFASKSNTPNPEWSTCSNESLFSIHTGNMSFTRDQFSWLLKSGELSMYGGPGDIRKSGELPPPSPKTVPKSIENNAADMPKLEEQRPTEPKDIFKSGEEIIANHFKASANKGTNIEAVKTLNDNADTFSPDLTSSSRKDDLKSEKSRNSSRTSVDDAPPSANDAKYSDASGQSFAFPVLAEIDKEKPAQSGQSQTDRKNSSASDQDIQKTATDTTSAPQAASQSWCSWISSYFSCCPCR